MNPSLPPAALALTCALLAPAAHASLCPGGPGPGQVQIGVARGPGFNGVPICAPDPNAQAQALIDAQDQAARDREDAAAASRNVLRGNIEALTRLVEMSKAAQRSMAGIDPYLSFTPAVPDYDRGWWAYPQLKVRQAKPGDYCQVLFTSRNGLLGVSGPGGDYRGAMLIFWHADIPAPKELQLVPVSLGQDDETTVQTVKAYNYTDLNTRSGALALAVPTLDALLDNMQDKQTLRLSMNGRQVVNLTWHSGREARGALNNCAKPGRG